MIKIFFSYSHNDIELKKELVEYLNTSLDNIEIWTDDEIRAGEQFNKKIYNELGQCDIAIFLITDSLVTKYYINKIEMPFALKEYRDRGMTILPIIVNDGAYSQINFPVDIINELAPIPEESKTLKAIELYDEKNHAFDVITQNLKDLIESQKFNTYLEDKREIVNEVYLPEFIKKDIDNSIQREQEEKLDEWLESDKLIAYIEGDEGVGKSVLVAQFAKKIDSENYFVFYFESLEWESFSSVDDIFLRSFGSSIENKYEFFKNFDKEIIFILDGVNEKNALEAYNRILSDLNREIGKYTDKIKLLFTTRKIIEYQEYNSLLWSNNTKITLDKFTKTEFDKMLEKYLPEFTYDSFPKNLLEMALYPRYFSLTIKLKDKLENINNITKEILYWEWLKYQIEYDEKFRKDLSITSLSDIETKLFSSIENNILTNENVNESTISQLFGKDFNDIKIALKELKLVTSDVVSITINFDLIVLAYAIYLLYKLDKNDTLPTVIEIADYGKQILEPYVNDSISNVPYITFLISVSEVPNNKLTTIKHTSLLYMWVLNHNSELNREDLNAWLIADIESFLSFLDVLYFKDNTIKHRYQDFYRYLITLIGNLWRDSKGQNEILKKYISAVLLREVEDDIMFQRVIFILFYYLSEEIIDVIIKNIKINEETGMVSSRSFSKLFRFVHKEDVFRYLEKDEKYKDFVYIYGSYILAEKLGIQNFNINQEYKFLNYLEKYFSTGILYREKIKSLWDIDEIKCFSPRLDIEILDSDIEKIDELLESSINGEKKEIIALPNTIDELFPLYARYNRNRLVELSREYLYECIKENNISQIDKFSRVYFSEKENYELVDYILKNKKSYIMNKENKNPPFINKLMEIIFSYGNTYQQTAFIKILISNNYSCLSINSPKNFEYIQLFLRKKLFTSKKSYIWHKFKYLLSKKYRETISTYIYLTDEYDDSLSKWAISKLYEASGTEENNFSSEIDIYRYIMIDTAKPSEYFFKIWNDEKLKKMFYEERSSVAGAYITAWFNKEKDFFKDISLDELMRENLPFDTIGVLLTNQNRLKDLQKWGQILFSKDTQSIMYLRDIGKPIIEYANHYPAEAKDLLMNALKTLNKDISNGGRTPFSNMDIEFSMLVALLKIEHGSAFDFYRKIMIKVEDQVYVNNVFDKELFSYKYMNQEFKDFRKKLMLSSKNDLEALLYVRLMLKGNLIKELKEFTDELLESQYAVERQFGISFLIWFEDENSKVKFNNLIENDDSEYVRKYAKWGYNVYLQEYYLNQILREVWFEDNIQSISIKLVQIEDFVMPTIDYFLGQLKNEDDLFENQNTSKVKKIYISRFIDRVNQRLGDNKKIQVFKRTLYSYYRGEKIDDDIRFIQKYLN